MRKDSAIKRQNSAVITYPVNIAQVLEAAIRENRSQIAAGKTPEGVFTIAERMAQQNLS